MVSKVLYIEGTNSEANGSLREGFQVLFQQRLKGNMPRIAMGRNKEATLNFLKSEKLNREYKQVNVMVDSDKPETLTEREQREQKEPAVYYMIQEMEAWFLLQPAILDDCFDIKISNKIPAGHASNITDPSGKLLQWTKGCKMPYHKVHHGVKLLKKLNLPELENSFPDVKRLITALSN